MVCCGGRSRRSWAPNVGFGGRTMAILSRLTGDTYQVKLKGPSVSAPRREHQECRILCIGEIRMAGSQQMAAASYRLRQCADDESSIGGVGVLLSGDFAHRQPIGQRSLIYEAMPRKCDGGERSSAAAVLGSAGRRRFDEVAACVRLRVVYRQGGPCPFEEPAMRPRGGAMNLETTIYGRHTI